VSAPQHGPQEYGSEGAARPPPGSRMRRRLYSWILAGLCAWPCSCEQRFSSNPPALGPEVSTAPSADERDASPQRGAVDAAPAAVASSHALAITTCASTPQSCAAPEVDASTDVSYRVVFGSGRGLVRSREQAATDLYKELLDRTTSGERLDAEVAHAKGPATAAHASSLRSSPGGDVGKTDPLARCAFFLLDLVDAHGGVSLDVVHWAGVAGCTVSLGAFAGDGGASECLISEPQRAHRQGGAPGFSW